MNAITDTNGKLTWSPEYRPEFDSADLYPTDIEAMRQRARSALEDPTLSKRQKKLAKNVLALALWVEREVYFIMSRRNGKS